MNKQNNIYYISHNNNGDFMNTLKNKYSLYLYIGIFLIISYISIYQSSVYLEPNSFLYYKQVLWYVIGIVMILFIKKIKIEKIYNYSIILYLFNIILLIGLFFFGTEINNSKAWYSFFGISIQPSEFMKISILLLDIYIIKKFYGKKDKISTKKEIQLLLIIFLIFVIPSILTFLEPDTGAVIGYLVITLSIIYFSNINKKWFIIISSLILTFLFVFILLFFINQDLFINIFGNKFFYRIDRLINWQSKEGIQLNNSLIAIGSSGLLGHNKIPLYYPELETDFIFTSFSSIYGLIGGLFLIMFILSFDLYLLNLIKKIPNKHNRITLFAILSLFVFQHIQSIGMTIGILPIIGIVLPLISYGGSSVISYLILIGIIINIKEKV